MYCIYCVGYFILCLTKLRKRTILNINTYFTVRTTYVGFPMSTAVIAQRNLTAVPEIKQHSDNGKLRKSVQRVQFRMSYCSSSRVPYVIQFKQCSSLCHTVQAVLCPMSYCSSRAVLYVIQFKQCSSLCHTVQAVQFPLS